MSKPAKQSESSKSTQALPLELPKIFLISHVQLTTKYNGGTFNKLCFNLTQNFLSDKIWPEAKELGYNLTSNKWMQVVSTLLVARLRYRFKVPESVTGLLRSIAGPLGYKSVITSSRKDYKKFQQNEILRPDKPDTVLALLSYAKKLDNNNRITEMKFNFLAAVFHIAVLKNGVIQFPKKKVDTSAWIMLLKTIASNKMMIPSDKLFDPLHWQLPLHMSLAYSPITLLQRKKMFGRGVDRRNLAEVKVYFILFCNVPTQYQLLTTSLYSLKHRADVPSLDPQSQEEEDKHPSPDSRVNAPPLPPPPPYTKNVEPGTEPGMEVNMDSNNNEDFWRSLDQDAAASKQYLGFILNYTFLPNFILKESLFRLHPREWINDEVVNYFANHWSKEAPEKNVLWLDSFFASNFLFHGQGSTIPDPQTDKQELLFHRLDNKLITKQYKSATAFPLNQEQGGCYLEWKIIAGHNVPLQNNGNSCGIHVLWYLKHLLRFEKIDQTQTHPNFLITPDMTGKRVQLLVEYLQRCGISLDDATSD
ncbi:hypothetical protein BDP27DRAFT_1375816 [Rhodocollybia butyracea]|uniref:Ubiquitin-like protease family profile domain-containing protein n=1 Tax=Rhodocollybia butyracea TaxID=206335 RepID=A0A9P5P4B2_9AGAR|nr:hypothetical protein BDP27DRAFT_1375816 [Rhodocollybia butyracea]